MTKPVCSVSLDLDNQWSYMKTHGDRGWESFPSYLDLVVPRFLKILDDFGWRITVFIVGQDAALDKNREALKMIADAGHEIGNHSFNHEPWLHLYSKKEIEDEIGRAEEAIGGATEKRPLGFRGPGYSLSRDVLEILVERKYKYDASVLPTYIGPLARAYYFLNVKLSVDDKTQRKQLFGGFRDGLKPVKPYLWELSNQRLLEIPVTTMPVLKLPFHFSYLLYLSTFSVGLASIYFKTALALCRMAKVEPSLLLHPLDFLGGDDVPELAFFPAMKCPQSEKSKWIARALKTVSSSHAITSLGRHADLILKRSSLRVVRPTEPPEHAPEVKSDV